MLPSHCCTNEEGDVSRLSSNPCYTCSNRAADPDIVRAFVSFLDIPFHFSKLIFFFFFGTKYRDPLQEQYFRVNSIIVICIKKTHNFINNYSN